MKATDIQDGDTFLKDGAVLYRVTHVEHDNDSNVIARVQYTDGGDGARVWGIDQEVPLQRG